MHILVRITMAVLKTTWPKGAWRVNGLFGFIDSIVDVKIDPQYKYVGGGNFQKMDMHAL